MTDQEKKRDELAEKYASQIYRMEPYGAESDSKKDFIAGYDALLPELQAERERNGKLVIALEHYANHPTVIKEAYHSNESGQITCVHTFISHVAKQALLENEPKESVKL